MNPPEQSAAEALRDLRPWSERNREVVELGLAWLRRRVEAQVVRLRASVPPQAFQVGGEQVLSDLKADWLLRDAPRLAATTAAGGQAEAARRAYETARAAMAEVEEPAAIDRLAALFGLAPFDQDVLLLALAPHCEAAFQALYGYLHDRLVLGSATSHLALELLALQDGSRQEARARLAPEAPLRRFALLAVGEGGAEALAPLTLDERMVGYLFGHDEIDARVRSCLRPVATGPLPERHLEALEALASHFDGAVRPAAVLVGPRRSGRRAAAAALAGRFGLAVAELEPRALPAEPEARQARLALIAREARLSGFAVLIDTGAPARPAAEEAVRLAREAAEDALIGLDAPILMLAEEPLSLALPLPSVRLAALGAEDRLRLWRQALGSAAEGSDGGVEAVADQFALGPAEIAALAAAAPAAEREVLWPACREAAGRGLEGLAERLEPHFGWDDIVLPAAVRHDLEALAAQVRHRRQVYGRWGFDAKLPRGRGVSALFAGPSGVGKTMAAEVIARDLELDLYRIDLSGVVSKYIGETEKNLRRVFDAAEAAGAVLFFDEADALFGKRSEVKDSHDRYANIEVSYLLQRMEGYGGLAILATNLKSHLDDAFLRRLRFVIDIPFPDAALRRAIWERAFPAEAPTEDLDLEALARLEIAGGNITVIAVNAAFLAAADGGPIAMEHIARAARSELRKIDKELRAPWSEGR